MKIPQSRIKCRQKDRAEFDRMWEWAKDECWKGEAHQTFLTYWMEFHHVCRIVDRYWEGELSSVNAINRIACIIEGRSQ